MGKSGGGAGIGSEGALRNRWVYKDRRKYCADTTCSAPWAPVLMKGIKRCRFCKGTTYVHATKTPIHVQTDDCMWELDVIPFGPHWSQVGWAEKADALAEAGAPGSTPGLSSANNPFGTDDHAAAAKARVSVDLGKWQPCHLQHSRSLSSQSWTS